MAPATLIWIITQIATALWAYAGVLAVEWILHLRNTDQGAKVTAAMDLIASLVPVVILYVAIAFASSVLGIRSGVVAIALIVPAGLAWALHMALSEAPKPARTRLIAATALFIAVQIWRAF